MSIVSPADADDPLIGLDPHDRGREAAARDGVPGCREVWVQRQDQPVEADARDAHAGSIAQSPFAPCRRAQRCASGSLTVGKAASTVPKHSDDWQEAIGCQAAGSLRTMPEMCSSPPGRARWRIKTDGLSQVGQGSPVGCACAARRGGGVRRRATGRRVHAARLRPIVARSARHRGLQRDHDERAWAHRVRRQGRLARPRSAARSDAPASGSRPRDLFDRKRSPAQSFGSLCAATSRRAWRCQGADTSLKVWFQAAPERDLAGRHAVHFGRRGKTTGQRGTRASRA
jgi:hypothetical protein